MALAPVTFLDGSSLTTGEQQAELLYVAYFDRAGDPTGRQYWVDNLDNGVESFTQVATDFAQSSEAESLYPLIAFPTNNSDVFRVSFITEIYENLFNRAPDAPGLAYWDNELKQDQATLTGSALAAQIAGFVIEVAKGAQDAGPDLDLTTLKNKVQVAEYFTDNLEIKGIPWSTLFSVEAQQDVANTTSASSGAGSVAAQEAIIQQQLAAGAPGPTIVLTTGLDNVVISQKNTVVDGTFNGSGATFTPFDTVTGSGISGSTIDLFDLGTGEFFNPTLIAGISVSGVLTANFQSTEALVINTATSAQGWTGLANLNVTATGIEDNSITAAGTTNVTFTDIGLADWTDTLEGGANIVVKVTDTASWSTITVGDVTAPTGNVSITETTSGLGDAAGTVTVYGSATTTTVSVTFIVAANSDIAGEVLIYDVNDSSTTKAGAITTVTISGTNYGGGAATIYDNSLSNLTVNNVSASSTFTITSNATFAASTPTTILNLAVNNDLFAATIDDTNNEYKTINVTTGASPSTVVIQDTRATTLSIAGSSVLALTADGMTALKTIVISGAAGLNDSDLTGLAALTSVTDTSSGAVTLSLNDTVTSFLGASSTGPEVITLANDATNAIMGNNTSNSEVVFNAAAATFTAVDTGTNVTGFQILGVGSAGSGTFTMNAKPFAGYTSIDDQGAAGTVTFTGVIAGTALKIDAADGGVVTYQLADTSGPTDSVAVTLGEAGVTAAGFTVSPDLVLEDNNFIGIGTVSITANNTTAGAVETITQLSDSALSSLTIAGSGDLAITMQFNDMAATLDITDNSTNTTGLLFNDGIVDNSLTALTLAGSNAADMTLVSLSDSAASLTVTDSYSGAASIATLAMPSATTESFSDTGSGSLSIGGTANVATALASLTLSGAVAYTATGDAVTTGITVSGASDNAAVSLTISGGAGAGHTDSITLGNGNDVISDASANASATVTLGNGNDVVSVATANATATVDITVGTGANTIVVGSGTETVNSSVAITAGAHNGVDAITVGPDAGVSAPQPVSISGLNNSSSSDTISFSGDAHQLVKATTFQVTAAMVQADSTHAGNPTQLSDWVITADDSAANHGADGAAHSVAWFQFGGNTYIYESVAGATADAGGHPAGNTLVELVGTDYTFNSVGLGATGILTLHG
jgi:hypothetical protein